ncbi:hypothetical protein MP228_010347 [Amoeboaphelidium protococcarum]|nr:hypothetical protein MP228_010347 [Amoeboaphelidium protococcarum]
MATAQQSVQDQKAQQQQLLAADEQEHRLSAQEVSWQFIQEYYSILTKSPNKLHCFYHKTDSQMMHQNYMDQSIFDNGLKFNSGDGNILYGHAAIFNWVRSQAGSASSYEKAKVTVINVDTQSSVNGSILITVLGSIVKYPAAGVERVRQFVQTFLLAEQTNGYFVMNDILRYVTNVKERQSAHPQQQQQQQQQLQQQQQYQPQQMAVSSVNDKMQEMNIHSQQQQQQQQQQQYPGSHLAQQQQAHNVQKPQSGYQQSAPSNYSAPLQAAVAQQHKELAPIGQGRNLTNVNGGSSGARADQSSFNEPAVQKKDQNVGFSQGQQQQQQQSTIQKSWAAVSQPKQTRSWNEPQTQIQSGEQQAPPAKSDNNAQQQAAPVVQLSSSSSDQDLSKSSTVLIKGFTRNTRVPHIKETFGNISGNPRCVKWIDLLGDTQANVQFVDVETLNRVLKYVAENPVKKGTTAPAVATNILGRVEMVGSGEVVQLIEKVPNSAVQGSNSVGYGGSNQSSRRGSRVGSGNLSGSGSAGAEGNGGAGGRKASRGRGH